MSKSLKNRNFVTGTKTKIKKKNGIWVVRVKDAIGNKKYRRATLAEIVAAQIFGD